MAKEKYYSLNEILKKNAKYNVIFGERSNGKTYSVLLHGLKNYCEKGEQMALVRRWAEDLVSRKRGATMFDALVGDGWISKLTKGEWSGVYFLGLQWFLCRYNEKHERIVADEPFCFGFSISAMEHDKSTSYNRITTICFDEFITRNSYLPDEFVLFENVCSTIIRQRTNVTIFMLGNTVNKYCPYFKEMGLTHIKDMKQGTIDLYTYGKTDLTVAVEYTASGKGKASDVYFAFDNPKLKMITTGGWELDIYPHCPKKYRMNDILFIYFIEFDDVTLQCEIVMKDDDIFTFIHEKTTELKHPEQDLIYSTKIDVRANWMRNILKPRTEIQKRITRFFLIDKVFYQDNTVGDVVMNYLNWCKSN